MRPGRMHADEPDFTESLVHRLIASQFPDWASLPVEPVAPVGTSHAMYRLGEDLVVRLPRTAGTAGEVETEQRWLPRLAPQLPAAIPVPLGRGKPAEGYPWHWSVFWWLDGANPVPGQLAEPGLFATDLADFVTALHRADPAGAPPSFRSEPLAARDASTRAALAELHEAVDTGAALAVWEAALRAHAATGPAVWIHADLQPGNVLLANGRLSAVIDFGCMGLGDAAVDLIAAWYLLPTHVRGTFRNAVHADDAAWARGRGWALSTALGELRYYRESNPGMAAIARHVIREVLMDGGCEGGATV